MTEGFSPAPVLAEIDLRLRQMVRRAQYQRAAGYGQGTLATYDANEAHLADLLGIHQRRIYRLRTSGEPLPWWRADEWAVRLGKHPAELWPSWFDGCEEALEREERYRPKGGRLAILPDADGILRCQKGHIRDRWSEAEQRFRCPTCDQAKWQRRKLRIAELAAA